MTIMSAVDDRYELHREKPDCVGMSVCGKPVVANPFELEDKHWRALPKGANKSLVRNAVFCATCNVLHKTYLR